MNKQKIRISFLRTLAVAACCALTMASCDDDMGSQEVPNEPYVLSLGITSNGTTTYYVVTTADLMSSTPINAYGKGIEQNGYRDYQQAGQTVFSIGGLGVTSATGIQRDANGYIQEHGDFVFNILATPTPPMKSAKAKVTYTDEGFSSFFGEEA